MCTQTQPPRSGDSHRQLVMRHPFDTEGPSHIHEKGWGDVKECASCGKSVADDDGLELTDGRFLCRSGGCQTRFLTGVYESKVKPDLLRQGGIILRSPGAAGNPRPGGSDKAHASRPNKKWWEFWK